MILDDRIPLRWRVEAWYAEPVVLDNAAIVMIHRETLQLISQLQDPLLLVPIKIPNPIYGELQRIKPLHTKHCGKASKDASIPTDDGKKRNHRMRRGQRRMLSDRDDFFGNMKWRNWISRMPRILAILLIPSLTVVRPLRVP